MNNYRIEGHNKLIIEIWKGLVYNMLYKISWSDVWRDKKMYTSLYQQRPAYTNNEIVNLFNNKIQEDNLSEEELAEEYGVDLATIKYMRDIKCRYSYQMLKIASSVLCIPYENLTSILIDEQGFSPRASTEENAEEFFEFINYIFSEMIRQERLSK